MPDGLETAEFQQQEKQFNYRSLLRVAYKGAWRGVAWRGVELPVTSPHTTRGNGDAAICCQTEELVKKISVSVIEAVRWRLLAPWDCTVYTTHGSLFTLSRAAVVVVALAWHWPPALAGRAPDNGGVGTPAVPASGAG